VEIQNDKTNPEAGASVWIRPWKYTESFIITINLLVLGFAVEAIGGGAGIRLPGFPVNLCFIIGLALILTLLFIKFKNKRWVTWMSGIPAAISAIVVYAVLVLLLGFIPQDMEHPSTFLKISGLSHVKSSWPFLLIQLYFLVILGMVTLRRAIPFKVKNIGFFLNHFGLWLTILAGGLSSSDLQRFNVNLYEGEKANNIGIAENGDKFELPFSLKLLDFDIIEYNPKIGIVNLRTGKYMLRKNETQPFVEPQLETTIANWRIKIIKYLPSAIYKNGTLEATTSPLGYPAALIFARHTLSGDTAKGWISSGSIYMHQDFVALKDSLYLILDPPEPKKFFSKLVVFKGSEQPDTVQVEVNKTHNVKGWTIYQAAYDSQMRRWSKLSVIEAVRDPWLPVVYTGIFFLLAGAVYMFWIGKDKKE
jgi:hypothetical protein